MATTAIDPIKHAIRKLFGDFAATPRQVAAFKAAMAEAVETNRRALVEVERTKEAPPR